MYGCNPRRVVKMASIPVFCQRNSGILLGFFRFLSGISGFFPRSFSVFLFGFYAIYRFFFRFFCLVFSGISWYFPYFFLSRIRYFYDVSDIFSKFLR